MTTTGTITGTATSTATSATTVQPIVSVRTMQLYLLLYVTASLCSLVLPHIEPVLAFAFAPIGLIAVLTMWRAGEFATSVEKQRAWKLLAVGEAIYWLGGQLWTYFFATQREFPLDDLFDLTSAAFVVAGLLCFPRVAPGWWRDRRAQLDALLLTVAVGTMVWLFLIQPLPQRDLDTPAQVVIRLLTTAPELVLVAMIYLRTGNHPLRASLGLWLGAAALAASADYLWDELSTRYLPGSWVDTPWFIAWGLRWYAAHLALQRAVNPGKAQERSTRGITPAAIVAGTYVSLATAAVLGRTDKVQLLGFVAVAMTALLLVRQRLELRYTESLTERAASQLRRFRALLGQATDFVFVLDRHLQVTFRSPSVERAALADIGTPFLSVFDPAGHDAILAWFEAADAPGMSLHCQLRNAPDSTIELRKQDRRGDPRIRGWVVVGRDRSMELALQQRVRHSEKLAALHDMAGRVAHAYNNLLSSIIGRAELLREALPAASPLQDDVTSIYSAADKGAAITRQLLGFSDAHATRTVVVDGAEVIAELAPVLSQLLPQAVTLDVSRVQPNVLVRVELSQFEQVVTNLVTNARDAMANGGVVFVSWTRSGDAARLEVADTGIGMSPEVQRRVFDPFFTTKPIGKGTGLGLAMVAAMVQRAGGTVTLHSTLGVGTRVAVELPLADAELAAVTERTTVDGPREADAPRTILLVDDDREVRQVSARILKRAGFQVIEAENGTNALATLADASVPLDLLLTDMMMPGISGADLVTLCRGLRPALPIICITGFVAAGDGTERWQDTVNAVVEKPFSASGLVETVHTVLTTSAV
jgi:signal transduction histidine kinase